MPRIDVRLAEKDPTFVIGQRLKGTVEVDCSDKGGRCDGLDVFLEWYTHGRGNTQRGEGPRQRLFVGDWQQGERRSYAFELPAVDGPLTYHGTEVNLDWRVVATADIPWAIDPRGEAEVTLARGEVPPPRVTQLLVPQTSSEVPAQALFCVVPFIMIFVLIGLGLATSGAVAVASGELVGLLFVGFGALFGGLPAVALFFMLRSRIAATRLGKVDIHVAPALASPGDEVRVTVSFTPSTDLDINHVSAKLEGSEHATRGSGTDRTTHTHRLFAHEERLQEGGIVRKGRRVDLEATLRLPKDAPASLALTDNEVRWHVAVHIDVASWPDWTRDEPLTVLPT